MEATSISLRETLGPVSFVNSCDVIAGNFCCDSRTIRPGDVFVAIPGNSVDGHQFIEAAAVAGAAAVVAERPLARLRIPQCIVPDARAAFARICMAQHRRPEKSLVVSGITGTNGKTTSTWLLRRILETAGKTTGLLGTIEYSDGLTASPAALTTPDSPQIARLLAQMVKQQASHCVMEISSHALDQQRCAAVPLSAAAITNITRDHFDYHGDADRYRTAKSQIANLLKPGAPLLIGIDDPGCRDVLGLLPETTNVLTFGFDMSARLRVQIIEETPRGQHLQLDLMSGSIRIHSTLVGRHNVLNVLTAAAMAEQLGVEPGIIAAALENMSPVPGRMERIDAGQAFAVLVDYAHTPDGIAHCVATARSLTTGRVILTFGAGGDRDRQKRPLMAQAAGAADLIFVTSDNPRSESPQQIIEDICQGFTDSHPFETCTDRNKAIQMAIEAAEPGDVVVIAGRGHELLQQVGSRSISFDDRRVAHRHLRELMLSRTISETRQPDAVPA